MAIRCRKKQEAAAAAEAEETAPAAGETAPAAGETAPAAEESAAAAEVSLAREDAPDYMPFEATSGTGDCDLVHGEQPHCQREDETQSNHHSDPQLHGHTKCSTFRGSSQ